MSDDRSDTDRPSRPGRFRFWEVMAMIAMLSGMLGILIYAWSASDFTKVFAVLSLVGLAAWMGGSLIGFLFGVPRYQAGVPQNDRSRFVPNTNLEQISDWLTKIIIGATLVQIKDISSDIEAVSERIGSQLGTVAGSTVSAGVLLFFFFTGFMWGYLWCSLRIFGEMASLGEQYPGLRESVREGA
jgi:hypothetical protein